MMERSKYIGKGYCENCEEEVDVSLVDNGIGDYEYWGARGVHHDWQPCCSQCGDYMEDFNPDYYDADSKWDTDPRV